MNFEEDRSNTVPKGTKQMKEVLIRYTDGSEQLVKCTEPTMVLIGFQEYQYLKNLYLQVQECVNNHKGDK